jgi:hypothetical protein
MVAGRGSPSNLNLTVPTYYSLLPRLGRGTTLMSSLRPDAARVGPTLLSSPGATLQCSPESVITVTVFLLYCVKVPVTSGLPSGRNVTRSPIRKCSILLCDRIWLRNRRRATILWFNSINSFSERESISKLLMVVVFLDSALIFALEASISQPCDSSTDLR